MTDHVKSYGCVAAFKLSPRHIHIYKGDVRLGVVNCEETITAYCVEDPPQCTNDSQTNLGSLWVASESGRIYHVDWSNLPHQPVRNDHDDNQDIFSKLLANQDTRIVKLKQKDCKMKLGVHISSLHAHKNLVCISSSVRMSEGINYTISVYGKKDLVLKNCCSAELPASWTKQHFLKVPISQLDDKDNIFLLSKELFQVEDENEAKLFDTLFSNGSALVDTCVILFASQSGILFYYKLKEFNLVSQNSSNIVCSLSQPIITIHTFIATLAANENQFNTTAHFPSQSGSQFQAEFVCMVVIGQNGKTMLIYQSKKVLHHQVIILPGSIVACHCSKNNIYFSTKEMLYRGRLSLCLSEEGELKFDLSVKRLGLSRITGISSVAGCTIDGHILFCFSEKGRLYTVEDDGQLRDKMAAVGTQMKDLIMSIGKTDDEVTRFKNIISQQNDILNQLSIASHLAALSAGGINIKDKASKLKQLANILKVDIISKTSGVGSRKEFSILVRLTNVSVAEFSSDWIFMVQLQHFQNIKQERVLSSSSKSLPLINGLRPEFVEEIEIPLEGEKLKHPLLTVSTHLVYNTPTANIGSKSDNLALCIRINEQRLEVLDFLEILTGTLEKSAISTANVLQRSDLCKPAEVVDYLAQGRPQYKLYTSSKHDGKKENSVENHSLEIHIDGNQHSILKKCETSADVLKQILSLTNLGVDVQPSSAVVRVCTFGGCHITLNVVSSQSEGLLPSSNRIGYKLTIQGEDLPVLVMMRSAFLKRLPQTDPVQEEDMVTEVHVRNILQTIKGIGKRMEEVNLSQNGQTDKPKCGQNENLCLSVYKQLRNVSFSS